jgi:precorrin-2 dehydrogenase/sirohydrochlorin ferrochelatase
MFYPLFLELKGRRVVVVGGGAVAERKVENLLEAEADVLVVAPDLTSGLRRLESAGEVQVRARRFEEQDLDHAFLVISATDDPAVQEQVAAAARSRNIPVNTVDTPRLCDFIVPAIVRKGDITVAISTSGKSPALAAELRARLDSALTDNAARAVRLLGEIRTEVHQRIPDPERRKQAFEAVVKSGLLEWIGNCDDAAALQRMRKTIEDFQ